MHLGVIELPRGLLGLRGCDGGAIGSLLWPGGLDAGAVGAGLGGFQVSGRCRRGLALEGGHDLTAQRIGGLCKRAPQI